MQHIHANTKIGHKFTAMIRWAQLSTGMGVPILQDNHDLPHLDGEWLKLMLNGMIQINRKLHLTETWTIPWQWEGDKYIMDIFIDSGQFSTSEIKI
eukprot:9657397-Ditylum_brightwellii.AAC.1